MGRMGGAVRIFLRGVGAMNKRKRERERIKRKEKKKGIK